MMVSIIVPVYNVEKYLCRCIDSLLRQTYKFVEIILVDDGSPDNCGAICDEYAKKDQRIRVFHIENSGASAARNFGLSVAQGEYIMFCDSDDCVSPQWVEHLVQCMKTSFAVLPMSANTCNYEDVGVELPCFVESGALVDKVHLFSFWEAGIAGYLWNAVYCADVIRNNNIFFRTKREDGDYNEDLLFNLMYSKYVDKIVYTGYADYFYNTHEGSLSRSYYDKYFDKYAEKYSLWKNYIEKYSCDKEKDMRSLATSCLYHFVQSMERCISNDKSLLKIKAYKKLNKMVLSREFQECIVLADASMESPAIIKMIQKKQVALLFFKLRIHLIKKHIRMGMGYEVS